jgi:CBS domain-containing protein
MSIEALLQRPVCTLEPDATAREAAQLMRDEGVGCVVVAKEGRPLGIVTDRDLAVRVIAAGRSAEDTLLRDVMSGEPVFLSGDRNLGLVITTMCDQGVRRIPVVDADGQLEGLLALDDLVPLLADLLGTLGDAIRTELATP